MMQNVIAFPNAAAERSVEEQSSGAMTLFIHIKCTTFIAHLAAPKTGATVGAKVGKRI